MKTHRVLKMLMMLKGRNCPISLSALANHFEVNARTIHRDISTIGCAGIEVMRHYGDYGKVSYSLRRIYGEYLP